jgi:hypothetical protein
VRNVKFQIYEWQSATVSGAVETRHCQWRISLFLRNAPLTHYFYETRHWWRVASFIYKTRNASPSHFCGVQTKHVTAVIHIFEILQFSLLFLIIIIINKNWPVYEGPIGSIINKKTRLPYIVIYVCGALFLAPVHIMMTLLKNFCLDFYVNWLKTSVSILRMIFIKIVSKAKECL